MVVGIGREAVLLKTVAAVGPGFFGSKGEISFPYGCGGDQLGGNQTILDPVGRSGVCLAIVEDNLFVSVFPLVEIGIEVDIPFPESPGIISIDRMFQSFLSGITGIRFQLVNQYAVPIHIGGTDRGVLIFADVLFRCISYT